MKIIIAPDSFKGSLNSSQIASCISRGVQRSLPGAEILELPVSDGGEGLVDSLIAATGGSFFKDKVKGPLKDPVEAGWGVLGDGTTAVIEMAAASGLPLVPEDSRNPFFTTTYGTGELIKKALDKGCKKIIIGIGGSATNDGGSGMAKALGARLLDREGREIGCGGRELLELEKIDVSRLDPRFKETEVLVACDVTNPLTGSNGASRVYAPQKGATEDMVKELDKALKNFARVIKKDLNVDVEDVPGAGAAGGLGGGLMAFIGGKLLSGIDVVLETVELEEKLKDCDMVITGEGKLDKQSLSGKVPVGVAKKARSKGVPVIAIAGSIPETPKELEAFYKEGIISCFSIVNSPMTLEEVMESSSSLIENTVIQIMQIFKFYNFSL